MNLGSVLLGSRECRQERLPGTAWSLHGSIFASPLRTIPPSHSKPVTWTAYLSVGTHCPATDPASAPTARHRHTPYFLPFKPSETSLPLFPEVCPFVPFLVFIISPLPWPPFLPSFIVRHTKATFKRLLLHVSQARQLVCSTSTTSRASPRRDRLASLQPVPGPFPRTPRPLGVRNSG